jgi:hypothetical protein
MVPPRGSAGQLPLQGDRWVGEQSGAELNEVDVAIGDTEYLTQVELTDYPPPPPLVLSGHAASLTPY